MENGGGKCQFHSPGVNALDIPVACLTSIRSRVLPEWDSVGVTTWSPFAELRLEPD